MSDDTDAPDCPFCGSERTERVGEWSGGERSSIEQGTPRYKCNGCVSSYTTAAVDSEQ